MTPDELRADRESYVSRIVESTSHRRLIVAGPGTGKTTAFARALDGDSKDNRVLTFIRNLRAGLEKDLGGKAEVQTLHGFADHVLHRVGTDGLTASFHYYPPLPRLLETEIHILTGTESGIRDALSHALHHVEEGEPHLEAYLKAADYYDAVSHTDAVFRLVLRLRDDHAAIPKHRLVIVDEVQDLSWVEMQLIELLAEHSPLLLAGDDDQALYFRLKFASADFIRGMANGGAYERFELPYCSRCTPVVVDAVQRVISWAVKRGHLKGRLDKPFECFLPDKEEDGKKFPKIKRVLVSAERRGWDYAGHYVLHQIAAIAPEEISHSHQENYPTVLIIGPDRFTDGIAAVLEEAGHSLTRKLADATADPQLLDGYRFLARNESDRLGWRIVVEVDTLSADQSDLLVRALKGDELVDLLPKDYRDKHLSFVRLIAMLAGHVDLAPDQIAGLCDAVSLSLDEILASLSAAEPQPKEVDMAKPKIMVTSYVAAKGLSAAHVFVTGLNVGHLPYREDPTDDEVRQFLVALSRTRKQCHLISCKMYNGRFQKPSPFVQLLGSGQVEDVYVDKKYISSLS